MVRTQLNPKEAKRGSLVLLVHRRLTVHLGDVLAANSSRMMEPIEPPKKCCPVTIRVGTKPRKSRLQKLQVGDFFF